MYIEPPITKISRPDLLDEYPYTLITGGRSHAFFHLSLIHIWVAGCD